MERFSQLGDRHEGADDDEDDPWDDRCRDEDYDVVHAFEDDFHLTVIPNFLQDSDAYIASLECKLHRAHHTRRQVTAKDIVAALAAESGRHKPDDPQAQESTESEDYGIFAFWPNLLLPISRRLFPRTALNKEETLQLVKYDALDTELEGSEYLYGDRDSVSNGGSRSLEGHRIDMTDDAPIIMYERPEPSELQIPKAWQDDLARQEEAEQWVALRESRTDRSRSALSLSTGAGAFPATEDNTLTSFTGLAKPSNDALYHFAYIRTSVTSTLDSTRIESPTDYRICAAQASHLSCGSNKAAPKDLGIASSLYKASVALTQQPSSEEEEGVIPYELLSARSLSMTRATASRASSSIIGRREVPPSSAPTEAASSSTKESVACELAKSEDPFLRSDDVLPHMSSLVRASVDEEDEAAPTRSASVPVQRSSESITSIIPRASSSGRCQDASGNAEAATDSPKLGTESEKSRYSDPHSNVFGESSSEVIKRGDSTIHQPMFRMFGSFPQDIHTALQSSIRSWVHQKSVDSSHSQARDAAMGSSSSLPLGMATSDVPTKSDGSDRQRYGGTSELEFQTANTCDSCFSSKMPCKCNAKNTRTSYKTSEHSVKKESISSINKYATVLKSKTSSVNTDLNSIPEGSVVAKTLSCISDERSRTSLRSEETVAAGTPTEERGETLKPQVTTIGTSSIFKSQQRSVHWFEKSADDSEPNTTHLNPRDFISPLSVQFCDEQLESKLEESRPTSAVLQVASVEALEELTVEDITEKMAAKQPASPVGNKKGSVEAILNTGEENNETVLHADHDASPIVLDDNEHTVDSPDPQEATQSFKLQQELLNCFPFEEVDIEKASDLPRATEIDHSLANQVPTTTDQNNNNADEENTNQPVPLQLQEGTCSVLDNNGNEVLAPPPQPALSPETDVSPLPTRNLSLAEDQTPSLTQMQNLGDISPKSESPNEDVVQPAKEIKTNNTTVLYCQEIVRHGHFSYSSSKDVLHGRKSVSIRKTVNVSRSIRVTTSKQFKSQTFRRSLTGIIGSNGFDKPYTFTARDSCHPVPLSETPISDQSPQWPSRAVEYRQPLSFVSKSASCSDIEERMDAKDSGPSRSGSLAAIIQEEPLENFDVDRRQTETEREPGEVVKKSEEAVECPRASLNVTQFSVYDISLENTNSDASLGLLFMLRQERTKEGILPTEKTEGNIREP